MIAKSVTAANLPQHHADPFDRALIGQAKNLDLTIITKDQMFQKYDIPVVLNR